MKAIQANDIEEIIIDSDVIEGRVENNKLFLKTYLQPTIIDSNFQELGESVEKMEATIKRLENDLRKQENKINVLIETVKHQRN